MRTLPQACLQDQADDIVETGYETWKEPLPLRCGISLAPVTLAYQTYGRLSPARDNAVLVPHALSGDAHVGGRLASEGLRPGWWGDMVGSGRPLDTDRYFVICSNVLGGCRGSTGPASPDPATGRVYGTSFPVVTIADMVSAQARLLDRLGIETLLAVVGGSMGGYQAIQWTVAYPERVRAVICLASCIRSTAAQLAWNAIGRRAIMSDPRWRGGRYHDSEPPRDGLAVARMIGHITYVSDQLMERKFGRALAAASQPGYVLGPEFSVETYLDHQGMRFNSRFDANSYLYILKAMDYWDLPAEHGSAGAALAPSRAAWLLATFTSDRLYPSSESELIADVLRRLGRSCEHVVLDSSLGHDAFLIEVEKLAEPISRFLDQFR